MLASRATPSGPFPVYLPPIKQGDLLKALRDHQPSTVVIIDGYFEQVPSVWHKEILWALKQGVTVIGAASMGALRAAELQQFGMLGVGKIFEAYCSGRFSPFDELLFEDDDEVAVVHGPPELDYIGSLAMVDLRASLAGAEAEGSGAAQALMILALSAALPSLT